MIAKRFEDLIFWQRSRELSQLIYSCTKTGKFCTDFGLKDQIQRSSVSVMSNIAEGFGRGSNKEFIQFLFIAKGSLAEVQSQLYVALDQGYIDEHIFTKAYEKSSEVCKLINAFISSLEKSSKKGFKHYDSAL
jgi:four helix bundle protein